MRGSTAGNRRRLRMDRPPDCRSPADLPTIAEWGLAGFEVIGWNGVHVPRGTSGAVIASINSAFLQALKLPDVQERMVAAGLDAAGSTPEEFALFVTIDLARWAKVIREAGIRPE